MKKRILTIIGIFAALVLAVSLCACSGETDNTPSGGTDIPITPNTPVISITAAYNQATELGYTGTLEDFIALISGKDGEDGKDGADGTNGKDGQDGKDGEDGKDGINGTDGKDGENGADGKDGRGIANVTVNASGNLIIMFTDGRSVNAGQVVVKCVHIYQEWQVGEAATCTSIGYDTRVCSKCGDEDYRFTEKLGHNYGNVVTVIKKHCTEYGLQVLTCSRCGDTKSQAIEPQGHGLSVPSYTCVYCGKSSDQIYLEENFRFNLINDGTAYEIGGRKRDTEGELIIPCEYNGLPVTKIMRGGFSNYDNITKVVIPEGITEIAIGAFISCDLLTSVVIPKTVTVLSSRVFDHVDLEDIQIDPENPIYGGNGSCIIEKPTKTLIYGNSAVNIPDDGSVEHIGNHAFCYRKNVGDIVIPEGIKTIGSYSFDSCYDVTSLSLPSTVTSIGRWAFYYCIIRESITVDSANTVYKSVGNCLIEIESKTLIKGCNNSVIPSDGSVTTIGAESFKDCSITEITVPECITSILDQAFYRTKLNSITLPDTLRYIGDNVFYWTPYYDDMENWVDGALYIGKYLIKANSSLPEEYTVRDGTLGIAYNAFSHREVKKLVIPDSVIFICNHAFDYCKQLTDITIGAGVQIIGAFTFSSCSALERVTFVDPKNWERYTAVTGYEAMTEEDTSDPLKAAELVKITSIRVENTGYGYVWCKADEAEE